MKVVKALTLLVSACCFTTVTTAAQGGVQNRHTMMRATTEKVLAALIACDTAALVNMLDTGYNQLNKPGARNLFANDAMQKCQLYQKITRAFTPPLIDSMQLATDKLTHNTICILPMAGLPSSPLNIRKCALVVSFYPPKLFSMQAPGQCLVFYLDITPWHKE